MSNSSIWPIDKTRSDIAPQAQSGLGSDGTQEVLYIPLCSSVAGTSPSDCFVSYPWYTLEVGSYSSAERQSVYSAAEWATISMSIGM